MATPTPAAFIPTDAYFSNLPTGMTKTATPQGGTSYTDAGGNMYLPTVGGLKLAPSTLPANNYQPPAPGQGLNSVSSPAATPNASVQPTSPTPTPTSTGTTPNLDANGQPVQPQKTAAQIQAETDGLATQPLASDTGTRTSSTLQDNFDAAVAAIGPAPAVPDSGAAQTTANATPGGVNDLTTQINTLNDQYTSLENQLQQEQAGEASKPGVVASVINGRMTMLSAEQSKALTDLKAQITDAKTQLSQAQTAVKTLMANQQTDYKNAEAQWQFEYTKALTQYNDDVSQQDKAQANSKAAAQVIINSFKGTDAKTAMTKMDDTTLAGWATLELQAGMPAGTIQAAVENELNITKFVKGTNGSMYAYGFDAQGNPTTWNIGSVGGKTTAGKVNGTDAGTAGSPDATATTAAFMKSLGTAPAKGETREQFIRELSSKYPTINSGDIATYVYYTYPDGWDARTSSAAPAPTNTATTTPP